MKAKELMIGNWMQFADGSLKGKVTRIAMNEFRTEDTFVEIEDKDGHKYSKHLDELKPIDLTKEILISNDFKYHDSERGLYGVTIASFYQKGKSPRLYCDGDPFAVWFESEVDIHYVHEFQNVLTLCGEDSELILED